MILKSFRLFSSELLQDYEKSMTVVLDYLAKNSVLENLTDSANSALEIYLW